MKELITQRLKDTILLVYLNNKEQYCTADYPNLYQEETVTQDAKMLHIDLKAFKVMINMIYSVRPRPSSRVKQTIQSKAHADQFQRNNTHDALNFPLRFALEVLGGERKRKLQMVQYKTSTGKIFSLLPPGLCCFLKETFPAAVVFKHPYPPPYIFITSVWILSTF